MAQRRRTYAESASLPDKKRENEEFRETKVVRVQSTGMERDAHGENSRDLQKPLSSSQ